MITLNYWTIINGKLVSETRKFDNVSDAARDLKIAHSNRYIIRNELSLKHGFSDEPVILFVTVLRDSGFCKIHRFVLQYFFIDEWNTIVPF